MVNRTFQWVIQLEMAIFSGYLKLPDGISTNIPVLPYYHLYKTILHLSSTLEKPIKAIKPPLPSGNLLHSY